MASNNIPINEDSEPCCSVHSQFPSNSINECLPQTKEEILRLVQELEVHQIKLEMQNAELCQAREEVESALATYTDLYDFAPVGYFTLDREGIIRAVNLTASSLLGLERSRLLGSIFGLLVVAEARQLFSDFLAKVFVSQTKESSEIPLMRDGSTPRIVQIEAVALGSGQECRIALIDITVRKETEEALHNSEARYRNLFEMESDSVLMHYWETGRIIDANSAAIKMYGYSKEEFLQIKHIDISAEPFNTEKSIRNNETVIPLRLHRKKDGTVFPVEISVSYFDYVGRKVHVAVIRDITERLRSEERLIELNKKLRALGEHLQKVQEGERLAMARDIHDDIGQNITVLKLDLEWIERRIPADCLDLNERVKEMHTSVDQLTSKVQRIAADLRPPLLDSMGLSAAIEWYAAEFSARSGLECYVMLNEDIDPLDQYTATAVMRIVQEGLTNVVRHARATEVSVSLCKKNRNLFLEISDNGCGIAAEQIAASDAYGIMGMQERARICRGEIAFKGKPGCGTILQLTVPLDTWEIAE